MKRSEKRKSFHIIVSPSPVVTANSAENVRNRHDFLRPFLTLSYWLCHRVVTRSSAVHSVLPFKVLYLKGSDIRMSIIGYARVSTRDQKLDLQIDALKKYGVDRVFSEKMTGTRSDRPQLQELLKYVREGDTVVVWKLDRIGRSIKDLINIVSNFQSHNVNFVSLKENIDTSSATGKLIFNIFASLSEFERDIISERTRAGLESARARGRVGGHPRSDAEKVATALKMYHSNAYAVPEILKVVGISKTTLYRYLRRTNVN